MQYLNDTYDYLGIFGIFGFGGPPPVRRRGYFRPGPPLPLIGHPGFRYHHPFVVPAMILAGGAVAAASLTPHVVYVPRGTTVAVAAPPSDHLQYYSVDIPEDVYPGEVFRVVINGKEVLVTCPDCSGPGERLVVAVEEHSVQETATVIPVAVATPIAAPTNSGRSASEPIGTATIIR